MEDGVRILGPIEERFDEVLTDDAIGFLARLQREFGPRRLELLEVRRREQATLDAGGLPDFLPRTDIREGDWRVASPPPDLVDRRVEITGPVDRKMMINALNSGARCFMADLEDANSPTWSNCVAGQVNLIDAGERTIALETPDKTYRLGDQIATLLVRPRGWHLSEKHVEVDGERMSASLFDFGLAFFHGARRLLERGSGPYFYLPKLESHLEARVWNDVFGFAQDALRIPRGTIRCTVLIETILAAFRMDEILFELREHGCALNAGRWDYIFSVIKKLGSRPEFVLPDRAQVTMTVPFMRAYTELLVATCHRRGAHAIGGMAAFIPSKDEKVNEQAYAKVLDDKTREARDGFDGSWVAHPGMVATCREVFDAVLGDKPNQRDRTRDEVHVTADELLDVGSTPGDVTEAGLRGNISVGLQYIETWLRGQGAVGINNMMEDAATAELSRSQVWQWLHNDVVLADGPRVTRDLVERLID
ncbi:MAG: malate synthase A, partial [Actinomycetota bacterium]